METIIPGIHHVTAIAGDPQTNLDFYTQFLGLRLVKKTVNFDDPGTYHFYFGDRAGTPGTILTFFPWPNAYPGRVGAGFPAATAFSIGPESMDYWMERFAERAYDFETPLERFGEPVLRFRDPDGLALELVAHLSAKEGEAGTEGPIPPDHALRSFHSVTLCLAQVEPTARLLTETFGYEAAGEAGDRFRFRSIRGDRACVIDLRSESSRSQGRLGSGTVHHVAFRAADENEQLLWRDKIDKLGFHVTPVLDRQYFRSIYFREPGGVLFEIATDPPGFLTDESLENLGTGLRLPPWLEPRRAQIERTLPEVTLAPSKAGL